MANLLVRNIDDSLVQALRERAAQHGSSVEAEHRKILADALFRPKKRSFAEVPAAMPNVGEDEDFSRVNDVGEAHGLTLVTRNIKGFAGTGVRLFNPFSAVD